jgi:hypothetical protein
LLGEKDAFLATLSLFTKEEAFQYLKLREIDKEQAAQIYGLVGGRMIHLKYMAEKTTKVCIQHAIQKMVSYRLYRSVQGDVVRYEG